MRLVTSNPIPEPTRGPTLIAHIWGPTVNGWRLEIASGTIRTGFTVQSDTLWQSKTAAKRAALALGARPWNY